VLPQAAHDACQAAQGALQEARVEAAELAQRLAGSEAELRALLEAVEHQKASSAAKMAQLASLLSDMA
jgi:leucine-rich repeat and coiled-coil domain-containing protein 1